MPNIGLSIHVGTPNQAPDLIKLLRFATFTQANDSTGKLREVQRRDPGGRRVYTDGDARLGDVAQGAGTSYTITIGALNRFAGTVNLAVSGLPANATASFTPASIGGAGSATLNVTRPRTRQRAARRL